MQPSELLGADFVGYDAPPAIVGKPGEDDHGPDLREPLLRPRTGPAKLRWWVSGYDSPRRYPHGGRARELADQLAALRRRRPGAAQGHAAGLSVRGRPHPDLARRAEPSLRGQFRQSGGQARPARCRASERRSDHDVTIRFAAGDFARQQWTEPAKAPAGKVYGHGKGYFEYRIAAARLGGPNAHPESFYYLFQAGSKAKRERVDWPERVNRQDYPQTDAARTGDRRWP